MSVPAFQFYPRDWLSSEKVTCMTLEQEGAYIRLLCYDWLNDGIPSDPDRLAQLSRMGEGWLKGSSRVVQECFISHPWKPGFITNPRLQEEREKQAKWREKCKLGGKKSGEIRASNSESTPSTKSKGSSTTVGRVVELKGNSASSSASASADINTQCVQIYSEYPLKVGRPSAIPKIRKAVMQFGFDFVLERTKLYAHTRNGDKEFMPNPSTWFNQQRFNDDPSTWVKTPNANNSQPSQRINRNLGTLNENVPTGQYRQLVKVAGT